MSDGYFSPTAAEKSHFTGRLVTRVTLPSLGFLRRLFLGGLLRRLLLCHLLLRYLLLGHYLFSFTRTTERCFYVLYKVPLRFQAKLLSTAL